MNAAGELKALLLREPRLTLAVAESLTAGNVQARIATISGASDFFLGGITAYSLEQKVRHLGIDRAAAEKVNCVSAKIAEQMATGVRALFGADVGVATTGYAEPSPKQNVTVPFAWWAVAIGNATRGDLSIRSGRVDCPGASRVQAQSMVTDAVLVETLAFVREVRGRSG